MGKEKADFAHFFFSSFLSPHARFNLKAPPPRESCNVETFLVKFRRPTHLLSPSRCNFFSFSSPFFSSPRSLSLSLLLFLLPRSTGRSENLVLLNYPPPMDRCKCTRESQLFPTFPTPLCLSRKIWEEYSRQEFVPRSILVDCQSRWTRGLNLGWEERYVRSLFREHLRYPFVSFSLFLSLE